MATPRSRLQTAATEFGATLRAAFVRHSSSIFVALAAPAGLLVLVYVESGSTPIPDAVPVTTTDPLEPVRAVLLIALYALVGLVFGLFVWIGIPVLVAAFFVTLWKAFGLRRDA